MTIYYPNVAAYNVVSESQNVADAHFALDSSGNIAGLVGLDGNVVNMGIAKKPRVLKELRDLANCTISGTNCTVVSSIDQNSPYGGPALKLVLTPTLAGGRCEVTLTNLNIPQFDDHVAASVYVEDVTRLSSALIFHSDSSGFTNYTSWQTVMFSGGNVVGGHRVFWGGPMHTGNIVHGGTGFIHGQTTLKTVRLRIVGEYIASVPFTVWVKDIFIAARQRPIVCFTFDDASSTWMDRALPYLNANNIKATFGIYSSGIDGGAAYVTSADVQTLIAAGHQIASHNVNNYRLQTLGSHGNGEQNGSGTSVDSVGYVSEYHTARQVLEGLGAAPDDFCYHPWVQGGNDTQAVELLRSAGVSVARSVTLYAPQIYGFRMGNNAMSLFSWPLSNEKTLAQDKAAVDQVVKYGGLLVFMGHELADTASDSLTIAEEDFAELVEYVVGQNCDVLTMKQLALRLDSIGALEESSTNPAPAVRMISRVSGANMNSTADQAITLPAGNWTIRQVFAVKGSISMTTAAGGVYTAASKGGTAIVGAAQGYTALVGATTDVVACDIAATPTVSGTIYFSLTTPQGEPATADIFVFAAPA